MAKMIKCPTCGTQIEVPAGAGAQVIKCPGCGKGLKIVAKKPPPAGMQGAAGGSMSGSVAGGSVSAMSFHGEPPAGELPSLDYTCQVCGTPTDPDRLIEDNGVLKCPDCIKGARSKIDRPDEAPDLLDFKRPLPPARRGKLIRVTPSLIGLTAAGLIYIGCQIYLTLIEPPRGSGRAVASPVEPKPPPAATPPLDDPQTPATTMEATTDDPPASTDPTDPAEPMEGEPGTSPDAPDGETPVVTIPDAPGEVDPLSEPPSEGAATAPRETAQGPNSIFDDPDPGQPTTLVASLPTEPLALGVHHLQERDYRAALQALETARTRYRLGGRSDAQLTPEQQMVLVGLAAANLGRNQPESALVQLNVVLGSATNPRDLPARGKATRSAVLNYTIATLSKRPNPTELARSVELMRQYLARAQGDEYAADIFGTLLDRVSALPIVTKEDREVLQRDVMFLDTYTSTLARDTRPNELKWGVEWKPREQVMNYRAARGRNGAPANPEQLQRELEAARARVLQLQQAVEHARATPGSDVIGAQIQHRDALATLADLQMRLEQAAQPAPKPRWLEKFQPVVPEGTVVQ